jgi:hypothetical protein
MHQNLLRQADLLAVLDVVDQLCKLYDVDLRFPFMIYFGVLSLKSVIPVEWLLLRVSVEEQEDDLWIDLISYLIRRLTKCDERMTLKGESARGTRACGTRGVENRERA